MEEAQECTFRPNLTATAPHPASDKPFDRLYQDAKHNEKELRRLQLIADNQDVRECTFVPNLVADNSYASAMDLGVPVHDKLYQDADRRQQRHRARQGSWSGDSRKAESVGEISNPDQLFRSLKEKIARERNLKRHKPTVSEDKITFN
jgi:hypothetical protein